MTVGRLCLYLILLIAALTLGAYLLAVASSAQTVAVHELKPDMRRAFAARQEALDKNGRKDGYIAAEALRVLGVRPSAAVNYGNTEHSAASVASTPKPRSNRRSVTETANTSIAAGTSLSRILHTSQLSLVSSAGTDEQYVDRSGDLVADERTTFDNAGGSF